MASDQDLALVTEAEAIARAEAMRVAYERAADLAGQALRAYVVADLALVTEAEAIARAEAMRVAYERAADLAGQALRAYVVADLDLVQYGDH